MPLGMLAAADNPRSRFEARMREMGGTPVFNRDVQLWTVMFDDGERKLDVWASRPLFRAGEREWTIDGRPEILLSNAQILRGKPALEWLTPITVRTGSSEPVP